MVTKDDDMMPLQTRQPIKVLPDGTYNLVVKNVVYREKNSYGNADYMFVFNVADGPEAGNPVFEFTPAFLSPGKKLWNLLLILGVDPKSISGGMRKSDLVGKGASALLGLHPKGHRNKIISMFPRQPAAVTSTNGTVMPVNPDANKVKVAVASPSVETAVKTETKVNEKVSNLDDIAGLIQF